MNPRQAIRELPRLLREALAKGAPDYERVLRATGWGDGPLHVIANGAARFAALRCLYAFEDVCAREVVLRPPREFTVYSQAAVRPGALLLALSPSGESEEIAQALRAARARGAKTLLATLEPAGSLTGLADGLLAVHLPEAGHSAERTLALHVAVSSVALAAARVFKRPEPRFDALTEEMAELPEKLEWVLTQLADVSAALAQRLAACQFVRVCGGGFYHPAALEAARQFERGVRAVGCSPEELRAARLSAEDGVLLLSGSRCRMKKDLHSVAAQVKRGEAKLWAVTDAGDRELAGHASLTLLLPTLSEFTGSLVSLMFQAAVAAEMPSTRAAARSAASDGALLP